ncbi:MAG: holo-ACP synthase [Defluviitaleaceae bacterium]|nr:holo-ACP synthase [Defluviitaleaceae bacterium]
MKQDFSIGIDIVKIARFENLSQAFLSRFFTEYEREYIAAKGAESAAGMFAAKEAVVKALGTGFRGVSPADVEIRHKKSGQPYIVLRKNRGSLRKRKIRISISHSDTDAVAVAVVAG